MILNINKEIGWTSFDVVAKMRTILKTKHVGHAGTLDPLATGVLVVLTEKDTKSQDLFLKKDKEYMAKIMLGISSPTDDMEGPIETVVQEMPLDLEQQLKTILPKFIGTITQQVPNYSAAKIKGKALYKYARAGVEVKAPVKQIQIFEIEFLGIEKQAISLNHSEMLFPVVSLRIVCGSGTYIRSLARDLGDKLGVGGVLFELCRTRVGEFALKDSKSIGELEKQFKVLKT